MPSINMIMDGDGCWPDLNGRLGTESVIELMGLDAPQIGMALLRGGMQSGKPSITIRIDLPDGRTLLTETSLALLSSAARAFVAAAGEG